jgi:uncharacterized protein
MDSTPERVAKRGQPKLLAIFLWALLVLFTFRVAGQLFVATGRASLLPPMEQWESGLLPYRVLLISQIAILVVFSAICVQFTRGRGYFVRPRKWLATPLWILGWIYSSAMVLRYAVWMMIRPDQRWTGDLIPVIFHLVLAGFLLTVARHHRTI